MLVRRVAAAVLLAAAATVTLTACDHTSQPGREDLLPEASLTYPGAVETDQSFVQGDDDRGIDGNDLSNPSRLERSLSYSTATAGEVLVWYRQRLEEAGWTYREFAGSSQSVKFRKQVGDVEHLYEVRTPRPGAVVVVYVMSRVD